MIATCAKCGNSVDASSVSVLVQTGWWITDAEGGVCPPCARDAQSRTPATEGMTRREAEVDRQITAQSELARGRRRRA